MPGLPQGGAWSLPGSVQFALGGVIWNANPSAGGKNGWVFGHDPPAPDQFKPFGPIDS